MSDVKKPFTPNPFPLGDVAVTETAEAVFKREEGGKQISHVTTSCGCTTLDQPKPDATEIPVTFTADYLPEGVKKSGKTDMPVKKYITVVYKDDTYEILFLQARVFEHQPALPVVPDKED